jgi:hypothetical protein
MKTATSGSTHLQIMSVEVTLALPSLALDMIGGLTGPSTSHRQSVV